MRVFFLNINILIRYRIDFHYNIIVLLRSILYESLWGTSARLTLHFPRLSARIPLEIHVRLEKIAKQTGHTETKVRLGSRMSILIDTTSFAFVYRTPCGILTPVPIELISQGNCIRSELAAEIRKIVYASVTTWPGENQISQQSAAITATVRIG